MEHFVIEEDDYLAHYGILRRSGRYPWGSGGNAPEYNTGPSSFLDYVASLKRDGLKDTEIARGMGISTTALRAAKSIAKNEVKQSEITQAMLLREKGMSYTAIGERMGKPESSVRALLAPSTKEKADILQTTADVIRDHVDRNDFVDIGKGNEHHIGVSINTFKNAIAVLKEEGYNHYYLKVPQLGVPGKFTTQQVLAKKELSYSDVYQRRGDVKGFAQFSQDRGRTFLGIHPPLSVNPNRVAIRYAEDGGKALDGVIFVRPGVQDLSMGNSRYAQVRIKVGKDRYLKGMAVYKDDLPDGVDIEFNTNKSKSVSKRDVMKPISDDPDNPFGANISRQVITRRRDGSEKLVSAMNIVNEQGDWAEWSNSLSSQFLSKQEPTLAKTQLVMTQERRLNEYKQIMAMTNPVVRRYLLEKFADSTDAAAVTLKAAALPRQAQHVILPLKSIKPTEIYAPNYNTGDRVILIRHPHGGTFEIPELIVNNNNREAKRMMGDVKDAVGIHSSVADRLSGADFDGDTVIVAKNTSGRVKSTPALEGLKNFDARAAYPAYPGMKRMTSAQKQAEMGNISNLITDMTIKGANTTELAAAVRHSMVVIDAENHNLNWKESSRRNGIPALKAKYQGGANRGASTIISRARRQGSVPERKPRPASLGGPIDKATGRKMYINTNESYINKQGRRVPRVTKGPELGLTDDAFTLVSKPHGTVMERTYAEHSNRLKRLANQARKDAVNTVANKKSASAAKVYAAEVKRLNSARIIAERNAPLERQAQVLANRIVREKKAAMPDMDKATEKKISNQALAEARFRTGAHKERIIISQREWEAIQANAISPTSLKNILNHADLEVVKELASPKIQPKMTTAMTNRAQQMLNSGYTRAEVASALGVSLTTLDTTTDVKGFD